MIQQKLDRCPKGLKAVTRIYLYTCVPCRIIHNSQNVEATKVSIKGWMDKIKVTRASNGMLLFNCPVMSNTLRPHGLQHTRPPCPSASPEVCPSSRPLHRWCHPAISSSDTLFSFCPQSFPASGTFPMSQLFCIRWPKYRAVIPFTDHCLFVVKKFVSLKLWAMPCKGTQDGQVIVESSDKTWSTCRKEWQTTPVYLLWEPHELYK